MKVYISEDAFRFGDARSRTCKTVTGIRTPWSFHRAVIPRFRAMRPVRIEFGVHFCVLADSDDAVVLSEDVVNEAVEGLATVAEACNCLRKASCWRLHTVRSPSMSVPCIFVFVETAL